MKGVSSAVRDGRKVARSRRARELRVQRFLQPDDVTCGPTCLRKVYAFYGENSELEEIVAALQRNEDGGTMAVYLAISALKRGYNARIFSYDQRIFDPTWVNLSPEQLIGKITARRQYLVDVKRVQAADAYVQFLQMGGELAFKELTHCLLREIIDRGHPVLAGLSATYLYRFARERWEPSTQRLIEDDVAGEPSGHFVVITGYDNWGRTLSVLDPAENVPAPGGRVVVEASRLINAILLGDVTYDAVLLEVWPIDQEAA